MNEEQVADIMDAIERHNLILEFWYYAEDFWWKVGDHERNYVCARAADLTAGHLNTLRRMLHGRS